jgi:hypothetical protein
MVTSANSKGPQRLPEALTRAITLHAERHAARVIAYFDATGLFQSKPAELPAAFYLEFPAVLELERWERLGLRRHIDVDLPTYREAVDQLVARWNKGPAEFDGPMAAPLSHQVLQVWADHFAWDGQELLETDVIVGELDEDEFDDRLAEFIWNHRDELAEILHITGNK